MRIPPLYKKPGWQRFFAGVVIGSLISWFVFLFQFGVLQERQIQLITQQQAKIKTLEDYRDTLLEDYSKLNEENKKKLTIQDFKIELINHEKYNLAQLTRHNLIDAVMKDINHLLTMDVESLSKNKELLKKAIENKGYRIDDKMYKLQIYTVTFGTTLELTLKIELVK